MNLRAISLRSTYQTHSGRIDAVTAQMIVLDNGSAFRVSPNAEVTVDGRSAQVLDLRRGMTVTVRTPPQRNEVWTVEARSAACRFRPASRCVPGKP
ncbi:MAG: hypothetical protein FJX78_08115 [Armatimonadetes bacterium]|nr:hypothetical protein [Armatimonadota bacterium]